MIPLLAEEWFDSDCEDDDYDHDFSSSGSSEADVSRGKHVKEEDDIQALKRRLSQRAVARRKSSLTAENLSQLPGSLNKRRSRAVSKKRRWQYGDDMVVVVVVIVVVVVVVVNAV